MLFLLDNQKARLYGLSQPQKYSGQGRRCQQLTPHSHSHSHSQYPLPTPNTHYPLPIPTTHYPLPTTHYPIPDPHSLLCHKIYTIHRLSVPPVSPNSLSSLRVYEKENRLAVNRYDPAGAGFLQEKGNILGYQHADPSGTG